MIVTSVTTDQFAVTKFIVANISEKAVAGIRLRWLVNNNPERTKLLKQDKTPFLRFSKPLLKGESAGFKYSPVSFDKFYKQFVKNGKLNENFEVELMVDGVEFADGSIWKKEDGKSPDVNFQIVMKLVNPNTPCAMQKCVPSPNPDVNGGVVYSCGTSTFREICQNTQAQTSCTNAACNQSGGDGGGGGGGGGIRWDIDPFEDWGW